MRFLPKQLARDFSEKQCREVQGPWCGSVWLIPKGDLHTTFHGPDAAFRLPPPTPSGRLERRPCNSADQWAADPKWGAASALVLGHWRSKRSHCSDLGTACASCLNSWHGISAKNSAVKCRGRGVGVYIYIYIYTKL